MRPSKLLVLAVGTAALALAVRVLVFPDRLSAQQRLERLRAVVEGEATYDPAEVARRIQRALDEPAVRAQPAVEAALYGLRAEVRARTERYPEARADIEHQAAILGGTTPEMVLRMAELEALEGRGTDAWTRVNRLLQTDPGLTRAWRLQGKLESDLARASLERALDTTRHLLVRGRIDEARALLSELAARAPDDPWRTHLSSRVAGLYLPHFAQALDEALDAAQLAATQNAAARVSLAHSFSDGPDAAATSTLLELLREARQVDLAVDLGVAAYPDGSETPEVFGSLSQALLDAGQDERLAERVAKFPWKNSEATSELCLAVCREVYENGTWLDARIHPLRGILPRLRILSDPTTDCAALLYQGLDMCAGARNAPEGDARAQDLWTKATVALEKFATARRRIDPLPAAMTVASVWRARAWRALGDERREREDLGLALTPEPDSGDEWLRHVTGEDFLRHAELVLKTPKRGARRPEEDWTRGMSMLPERCYELLPRWEELGLASLDETGHELERVYRNMVQAGAVVPAVDLGPWAHWKLARMHLERRNHEGAIVAARRLLEAYPGLIPAHDLLIEAQLTRGSKVQVIEDILTRLEIVGPDEVHRGYVQRVGIESFAPAQLLRLMQLDPAGSGRLEVARYLLSEDAPERALRALGEAAEGEDAATRLVRARALAGAQRGAEAARLLEGLLADPELGATALVELVRNGLEDPEGGELEAASQALRQRLATDEVPPNALALECVDRALARGDRERARTLLEDLDSRAATRGGEVLWRLAIERWLAGDREAAHEALGRAEAFLSDGRLATARLAFAIEDRDWRALPERVADLRRADAHVPPLTDALLTVLEERLEEGAELAQRGAQQASRSAEWLLVASAAAALADRSPSVPPFFGGDAAEELQQLLLGGEHVPRDPRDVLGLLLILDLPAAEPWIRSWVERLSEECPPTWSAWCRARLAGLHGDPEVSVAAWRALTELDPEFGPGWLELAGASEVLWQDPWHPEVLSVRVAARRALRRTLGGSGLERAIDEAARQLLDRDLEGAAVTLATLVENRDGNVEPARSFLARILGLLGRFLEADREYALLIPAQRATSDSRWVSEYLDVLERGSRPTVRRSDRLEPRAVQERLAELQVHFPYDPLVPLERARLAFDREQRDPAKTVDQSLRWLDNFRALTGGVSLDSLRAGSTVAWGRHLLELSPTEAERFLLAELARAPGDLELWSLLAEALAALGRDEDTLLLYRAIVEMSDDPESRHRLAWELVARGSTLEEVEPILEAIRPGEDPYGPARARLLRAISELHGPRPNLATIPRLLEAVWDSRDPSGGVDLQLVGRTYAALLLQRGSPEDLGRIPAILDRLERENPDPYQRCVLSAFRGIGEFRASPEGQRLLQEARKRDTQATRGVARGGAEAGAEAGAEDGAEDGAEASGAEGERAPPAGAARQPRPGNRRAGPGRPAPEREPDAAPPSQETTGGGAQPPRRRRPSDE